MGEVGSPAERIGFGAACDLVEVGELVEIMEGALDELWRFDRDGVIHDDCTGGCPPQEFEESLARLTSDALADVIYDESTMMTGVGNVEASLEAVRAAVWSEVADDAYTSLVTMEEPASAREALESVAAALGSALSKSSGHVVEVDVPEWHDLVNCLLDRGLYTFDDDGVRDFLDNGRVRCELMLGFDGVYDDADPMTCGQVEEFLLGGDDAYEPDELELEQTPVLAFARSQHISVAQLMSAGHAWLASCEESINGYVTPRNPAERIFSEVHSSPAESVCQVGIFCSASARDILGLLSADGERGYVDATYSEPTATLYDRLSGSGGDGWLSIKGTLPISGDGVEEGLRVRQVLLPDASRCPFYTMAESFDMTSEVYDSPAFCRADGPCRQGGNDRLAEQARDAAGEVSRTVPARPVTARNEHR